MIGITCGIVVHGMVDENIRFFYFQHVLITGTTRTILSLPNVTVRGSYPLRLEFDDSLPFYQLLTGEQTFIGTTFGHMCPWMRKKLLHNGDGGGKEWSTSQSYGKRTAPRIQCDSPNFKRTFSLVAMMRSHGYTDVVCSIRDFRTIAHTGTLKIFWRAGMR